MERQAKDGTFYKQVGEDAWEPITRRAKDGTVYNKVGADEWRPVQKRNELQEKPSRKIEAALEGFGEGATLGYLNNIQGALEKPAFAIMNAITGQDVEADDYVKARDFYNKRQERLKEENPGSFGAGQVAGTIVSSMPVAKAAQGATVLGRAIQGAKAGSLYGAAQNTSEQEGDMGGLDLGERGMNLAFGAATGAGASLGVDGVTTGLRKASQLLAKPTEAIKKSVGQKLKDTAEGQMFKATGARKKDFDQGEVKEVGRWLLDKGEIKIGDSVDDIAEKTAQYKAAAGKRLDQVYSSAEDSLKNVMNQKGFDPLRDKQRILQAAKKQLGDTVGADDAITKLSNYLDSVAVEHGDKPYQQALNSFSKEKQKFIAEAKQYRKDLRDYRGQIGAAGEDINQGLLPAFADDLQRTNEKSLRIETQGRPASNMEAEPLELWTQQEMIPLPQRGQLSFNSPRGDDLLPLAQKMDMDQRYLREIGDGYQSEILNARLTPRSYMDGNVAGMSQGQGQMQFAIAPNRPVRPNAPEQIRNGMSPRRANDIKGALDEKVNYSRSPLSKEPASEKAFYGARKELNKIIDESIDELGGSVQSQELKAANREYGLSARTNAIANDRVNRESSNKLFGLTDTIAAGASGTYGAVTGDWQTAIATMAAKKGFEKYGTIGIAKLADAASKRLLKQPQMAQLAKVDPNAFKATVFSLVERIGERSPSGPISMPKAAESDRPTKGPEKWVLDGIDKLNQAGVPAEVLEQFKASPYGREILIEASDASPGSVRMKAVLEKIRTAQGGQ